MIDKDRIPEPLLIQMLELFGEEKTEKISRGVGYNYHWLILFVSNEKFKRRFGIRISTLGAILFIILLLIYIIYLLL